jgi:hypothetical protein
MSLGTILFLLIIIGLAWKLGFITKLREKLGI